MLSDRTGRRCPFLFTKRKAAWALRWCEKRGFTYIHRQDDGKMEIWYIVLHYNKPKDCKKGEDRMGGDGTKIFAACGGKSPSLQLLRRCGNAGKSVAGEAGMDGWR